MKCISCGREIPLLCPHYARNSRTVPNDDSVLCDDCAREEAQMIEEQEKEGD